MNSVTVTLPVRHTRPTSLRPRSTSMRCSARSFSLSRSSRSSSASRSGVAPRRRVPAIGWYSTVRPVTRTSISGEAPTMSHAGAEMKNMYGEGLMLRRAR